MQKKQQTKIHFVLHTFQLWPRNAILENIAIQNCIVINSVFQFKKPNDQIFHLIFWFLALLYLLFEKEN